LEEVNAENTVPVPLWLRLRASAVHLYTASGAVLGGAIGGALGWALAREEWQEFQPPAAARVSMDPDGATTFGISVRTR